ncbi:hypothetical protein WL88_30340 [Burkholderia diffusa]|uniref:Uncharacterized protein n=1 Tax=Burkholderia diffusa TaxID=488732 RepID=A0AAW3P634_9BURK|nr:hypothetical protein [Burkholderia diffusa]KVC44077.1 hypothetical protein WI71_18670 [Burkholderia diffusa]KWF33676.1 hypothetical protein WL86_26895 [Burkholderia diffusa]KWF33996.1 hypothetical protein WL85_18620 [Burkholderia diffusa]KWF44085.1 hypothetical protein WL88_30340 [Burkholderia diffusa]KWF54137.1 hypothetical protein WL87_11705 [Burkholderia diffusa]
MNDLIQDIAQIEVPHDLLDQIDMKDVLSKFRDNFKQLGDLKRARTEHEQRSVFMRLWHRNKLKDAQLDAQELQAEFSKSLAQLMVISMMQSQRLAHQQDQISAQQRELKRQTERLESHTVQLDQQQQKLHLQAVELKNLVDDYFELRGLTQEGAKKLIAIAAEVKSTRDELIGSVQATVGGLRVEHGALEQFVKRAVASLDASVSEKNAQLSQYVDALASRLQAAQTKDAARLDEFATTLAEHISHAQTQGSEIRSRLDATDVRHAETQQATQVAIDDLAACQRIMGAGIEENGTRIGTHADMLLRVEAELEHSKGLAHEMQAQLAAAESAAKSSAALFSDANRRAQRLARIGALLSSLALIGVVANLAIAAHWIRL